MATADPANLLALDDITMATGYEVRRAVASPEDIDALIENSARSESSVHEIEDEEAEAQVIELRESADDAPVEARARGDRGRGAARRLDIHFEPRAERHARALPRRRRGLRLHHGAAPPASGLVSRIKIMAELDIAEKRCPRTAASGCRWTATTWTCAWPRCRSCAASRS